MSHHKEHGNALFLILIAVALFAALSYAVSHINSTGAFSVSDGKAKLIATEIANYGVAVRTATSKVLAKCRPEQISFSSPLITTGANNPNAPLNESCHVFSQNGGGLYPRTKIPKDLEKLTFQNRGEFRYESIQIPNIATTKNEVVLALSFYGPQSVCTQFNKLMGIDEYSETLPEINTTYSMTHRAYNGTIYSNGGNGTGRLDAFSGKTSGCVFNNNDYAAHFTVRYVIFMTIMEL